MRFLIYHVYNQVSSSESYDTYEDEVSTAPYLFLSQSLQISRGLVSLEQSPGSHDCSLNQHTKIQQKSEPTSTKYDQQKKHTENIRPANNTRITRKKKNIAETGCKTIFCAFFVLLTRRRGCLLILRPDCLCFYSATMQKDSKFAKMLLDNTSKGQRDLKFNWLGGCYLHCGPHLSMLFGNQGQL